jgi:hypothetical protein
MQPSRTDVCTLNRRARCACGGLISVYENDPKIGAVFGSRKRYIRNVARRLALAPYTQFHTSRAIHNARACKRAVVGRRGAAGGWGGARVRVISAALDTVSQRVRPYTVRAGARSHISCTCKPRWASPLAATDVAALWLDGHNPCDPSRETQAGADRATSNGTAVWPRERP